MRDEQQISRWMAGMGLWDREAPAKEARRWLTGPGRGFLELPRSQIGFFHSEIARARDTAGLKDAIKKFLEKAKERAKGKSFWARHGARIPAFLDEVVGAATNERGNAAFEAVAIPLEEMSADLAKKAASEREYAIRREAIAALIELHRSQKHWNKKKEEKP